MKKFYLSIVSVLIIMMIVLTIFISKNRHKASKAEGLTPKEIWDIQFQKKKEKRKRGYSKADKPDLFTQYFKDITTRIGESESAYKMNYKVEELKKAKKNTLKNTQANLNFISRGPSNVGGRTRALIVDPDDSAHKTWYTGAATGGIWKTTDGGQNWTNLSDDFTNLSVNALAMAGSNRDIIYAGTGESFPGGTYLAGNGIWKSIDRGNNWQQLAATIINNDFAYVNRLIVNPENPEIVLAATQSGIFKSSDGGINWKKVYASKTGVEDLVEDPTNFNVLFAGENSKGILRSTDSGENWKFSSYGMGQGRRFEIAVSTVNHNKVFTSVDVSSTSSSVYMSDDNGLTWILFNDNQSFLGGQGEYDNTIEAHPFDENSVFVGGVDLWKVSFNGTAGETAPTVKKAYTENAEFLTFVNFDGAFLGGGMDTTDHTSRVKSDWVGIEIRFGDGLTQKAHRFTVPSGATSGVPALSYTYKDYVDVPFQVWDITNNRQLMVSFRDQERDGKYNLYTRIGEDYGQLGREYIFVNAVAYNSNTPEMNIIKNGGHLYKNLYMFWPGLAAGANWDPENLPNSKIVVEYGTFYAFSGEKTSIADSYGNYGGPNGYEQGAGFGNTKIPGLHPDHHNIVLIPTGANKFTVIDANDGGLGISYDNGETFEMLLHNYITTQFYGVAKNPEANEYFGGMQDNGSWQSPKSVSATDKSPYYFRIGGDGFECLWHAENPNLMLGSIYNNSIRKSNNGGGMWVSGANGIKDGDGPFITRLSASKEKPDVVFAVGASGIYKSANFGGNWNLTSIRSKWANGSLSSAANVEVSLANGNIVWAGAGMAGDLLSLHASTNEGKNFTPVKNYSLVEMGAYISGISTHPISAETAYVLFSIKGYPKVLRTTNLGQTWEDISGFGTDSISNNGFPDVVVHSLLVMPHDPNIIWVGTDIGLFESIDNGQSWHLLQGTLPPVSIYDMQISGNQVVIATHGRGIWSIDIPEIDNAPYIKDFVQTESTDLTFSSNFKVEYEKVEVMANGQLYNTIEAPSTGTNYIEIDQAPDAIHSAYILGYIDGKSYISNEYNADYALSVLSELSKKETSFFVYPNPSMGEFIIDLKSIPVLNKNTDIQVFNLSGMLVYATTIEGGNTIKLDLLSLKSGTYLLNIKADGKVETQKIIIKK